MSDDDTGYIITCAIAALEAGVSRDVIEAAVAVGWPWPARDAAQVPPLVIRPLNVAELMAR